MGVKIKLDAQRIHEKVVRQLETWVKGMPPAKRKRAIIGIASEAGTTLSPEQILENVRQGTPLGIELIENAIALDATDASAIFSTPAARERAKLN
jgi:hypothetical protein